MNFKTFKTNLLILGYKYLGEQSFKAYDKTNVLELFWSRGSTNLIIKHTVYLDNITPPKRKVTVQYPDTWSTDIVADNPNEFPSYEKILDAVAKELTKNG